MRSRPLRSGGRDCRRAASGRLRRCRGDGHCFRAPVRAGRGAGNCPDDGAGALCRVLRFRAHHRPLEPRHPPTHAAHAHGWPGADLRHQLGGLPERSVEPGAWGAGLAGGSPHRRSGVGHHDFCQQSGRRFPSDRASFAGAIRFRDVVAARHAVDGRFSVHAWHCRRPRDRAHCTGVAGRAWSDLCRAGAVQRHARPLYWLAQGCRDAGADAAAGGAGGRHHAGAFRADPLRADTDARRNSCAPGHGIPDGRLCPRCPDGNGAQGHRHNGGRLACVRHGAGRQRSSQRNHHHRAAARRADNQPAKPAANGTRRSRRHQRASHRRCRRRTLYRRQ